MALIDMLGERLTTIGIDLAGDSAPFAAQTAPPDRSARSGRDSMNRLPAVDCIQPSRGEDIRERSQRRFGRSEGSSKHSGHSPEQEYLRWAAYR